MALATWRGFPADARRFLLGAVLLELGHAFLWALQNLYVRSVGYGEEQVGQVLMASGVGVVLATLPSAWAYDRFGPRRVLCASGLGVGAATTGLALSTSFPALLLFSGLLGAAFMLHRVVAAPFLASVSEDGDRTRLFSTEFATHTVASVVGLAISGRLAAWFVGFGLPDTEALRSTLLVAAAVGASAVLAYRRITTSSREEGVAPTATFAVLHPKHWHLWWRLSLPHLLVGLGAGLTIPFINLYFTDRFGLATDVLGYVMAASQVTMTVGLLLTPRLVRRFGLLRGTVLTELASLPFFLTLAFTHQFGLAVVAFVLRAALMNLSHPMWRNLMMEVTPRAWRAGVNGVSMLLWNAGWATSNQLGGWLIEHSPGWVGAGSDGYVMPMLITTGAYLLAIGLELLFCWRWRELGRARGPVELPLDAGGAQPAGPSTARATPAALPAERRPEGDEPAASGAAAGSREDGAG